MSRVLAKDLGSPNDKDFQDGMKAHAVGTVASPSVIGDPIKPGTSEPDWEQPFTKPDILHGVILVTGNDDNHVRQKLDTIKKILKFGTSTALVKELQTISGKVRPDPFKGHEQ